MNSNLEQLDKNIAATEKDFGKALEEFAKVPETHKVQDPAMLGYVKKLQFRHRMLVKFWGQDVVIKLFNTFEQKDLPAPQPSLFLNDAIPALSSLGGSPATPRRVREVVHSGCH